MSSNLILYGTEASAPVRAVLLTLKALQLDYKFEEVNLRAGEQLKPEFVKKNPQHTVPALEDGADGMIWDSHAICAYLVRKYGNDSGASLYPKDFRQRAIVDQRLHYDSSILSATCLKPVSRPILLGKLTEIPQENIAQIQDGYTMLEKFLDSQQFMAGDQLTIADFSIVATLSNLHMAFVPIDAGKYPKLTAWLQRMTVLPYYEEANQRGAKAYAELIKSKLPKHFDKLWQKAVANAKSGKQQ